MSVQRLGPESLAYHGILGKKRKKAGLPWALSSYYTSRHSAENIMEYLSVVTHQMTWGAQLSHPESADTELQNAPDCHI